MNSKIEKSFQNIQFYRNYNNIDNIISIFKKIKNDYNSSKNKYKNVLMMIIDKFDKNQIKKEFLKKLRINIKLDIDLIKKVSCNIILSQKINIKHDIKKYIKYSDNINIDFMNSVKIGYIKNINILIENGGRHLYR